MTYQPLRVEEQQSYHLINGWSDKGSVPFPKGISAKVNVIVWQEFELIYFEAAVQHFSHYATETPTIQFNNDN